MYDALKRVVSMKLTALLLFIAVLIIFVINPTFSQHQLGKGYSSNPLGDGPKMRAKETKRKRHRNQSNESARNDKLELRLSTLESKFTDSIVNKIAQDAIPTAQLDAHGGNPENYAFDSQAGISGRRTNSTVMSRVFPHGLTRVKTPLRITGVVGGEVLLQHQGTARYNFCDAHDSNVTERYDMPGTWAIESSVKSWDTSIISVQQVLQQHPMNHFVRIEKTADAPYANDMGIVLHREDNTNFTTRIHIMDSRWWLSGRQEPLAKVNSITNANDSTQPVVENTSYLNHMRASDGCVTALCMSGRMNEDYMSVVRMPNDTVVTMKARVNSIRAKALGLPIGKDASLSASCGEGPEKSAKHQTRRKERVTSHANLVLTQPKRGGNKVTSTLQPGEIRIKTDKRLSFELLDAKTGGIRYKVYSKLWRAVKHFSHAKRIIMVFPGTYQPDSEPVDTLMMSMRTHFPDLEPTASDDGDEGRDAGTVDLIKLSTYAPRRWALTMNVNKTQHRPSPNDQAEVACYFGQALKETYNTICAKFISTNPATHPLQGTVCAIQSIKGHFDEKHAQVLDKSYGTLVKKLRGLGATVAAYCDKPGDIEIASATSQQAHNSKDDEDSQQPKPSGKRRKLSKSSSSSSTANPTKTTVKRKTARDVTRTRSKSNKPVDVLIDQHLTPRPGRLKPIEHPSRVQLPYSVAIQILGGAAPARIARSAPSWANVDLVGTSTGADTKHERETIEMMKRRLGRRSYQSIRRPRRWGFTASMDWIIFSHPSLGGHMNALIVVEHWSSCSKTQSSVKRDMATAYLLLEDALDWFDAAGSGPAQRLIIYLSSDDDKSFNNKAIRSLCATRRIVLETEPGRQAYKNSKHETVIQDVKIGAKFVNQQGGGGDWSHASSINNFEGVRNRLLTVGDRPCPPLAMLTNRRYDMQYTYPFLTEILGMDICLSDNKVDPARVKLFFINSFQSGIIAIDELQCKEHRLSRRQFVVSPNQYDSKDPLSLPIAFEQFRLNVMVAPATNQGIVHPFSAMRNGLIRPHLLSKAAMTIYLRKLQRGEIVPKRTQLVKDLGSLATATGKPNNAKLERPGDQKAQRLGTSETRQLAKGKRAANKGWNAEMSGRLRAPGTGSDRRPPPRVPGKFIAPIDAAQYVGNHDDVCMSCNEAGGELTCCDTCPRTCHSDIDQCTDVQPIHPAATSGAITDKWFCSSCCIQFKNGTYVTLEDYEALEGRSVLSEGSQQHIGATFNKDFGEPHGCHYGTVTEYDIEARLYSVVYTDGDCESLTYDQLIELRPTLKGENLVQEQACRSTKAASTASSAESSGPTTAPKGSQAKAKRKVPKRPAIKHSGSSQQRASARLAQAKMVNQLSEADHEHRSTPVTSVDMKIPRPLERASARVNRLGPISSTDRANAIKHRLRKKNRRQEFAKARTMLTATIPTLNGIPIEFEHANGTNGEEATTADAEWIEDCTLEAAYDFVQVGTESRPQVVVNAMIVEDEWNPRPKTVLSPAHPNHQAWCAGIAAEMFGLMDRDVFEPVTWDSLSHEEKKMCLTSRLILKAKRSPIDGSITKFKARLTAGGHRSVLDYHFQDSSTPGASSTSPRLMSCVAALTRQVIYSWDIEQAYTQAELKQGRTIHIHIPPEMQRMAEHPDWQDHDNPFSKLKRPAVVLKLKKNLYGLKSGGVDFFTSVDEHMANDQNMEVSFGDTNLYTTEHNSKNGKTYPSPSLLDDESDLPNRHPEHINNEDTSHLSLCACWLYVDDGAMLGNRTWRDSFMRRLQARWRVDDAKPATDILNIVIEQSLLKSNKSEEGKTSAQRKDLRGNKRTTVRISQSSYIRNMIFDKIDHVAFQIPENVLKRRTPMDFKVMDILDWRDPKLRPGESAMGVDDRYADPVIALGYVSKQREHDTLTPIESFVSPFTEEYEYEELTIDDTSRDATKWSLKKMQSVFDYRRIIAQILWCARNTRPDLSVASSVLCRHAVNTPHLAYRGLVQTLRYMASTIDLGITYASDGNKKPVFYCDSDFTTGRCRAGALTMLAGGALDWSSALSGTVALSTAEAELYAAIIACQRALILRKDMEQLRIIKETDALDFREDNQATFLLLDRRVTDYSRMRHIENGFLKCLEWTCRKRISWTHEPTKSMLADFLTKCLPIPCFLRLRNLIMNLGEAV